MASRTFILDFVIKGKQSRQRSSFQENDVKLNNGFWLDIIAATPPDKPPTKNQVGRYGALQVRKIRFSAPLGSEKNGLFRKSRKVRVTDFCVFRLQINVCTTCTWKIMFRLPGLYNNKSFTFFFCCSYLWSVAYREFSRLVYAFLRNKRIPLPGCAYTAIRKKFQGRTDESFTGFYLDEDE